MVRKFFPGDDPLGRNKKKADSKGNLGLTGGSTGKKKLFGMSASSFIEKKMAAAQAKKDEKENESEEK